MNNLKLADFSKEFLFLSLLSLIIEYLFFDTKIFFFKNTRINRNSNPWKFSNSSNNETFVSCWEKRKKKFQIFLDPFVVQKRIWTRERNLTTISCLPVLEEADQPPSAAEAIKLSRGKGIGRNWLAVHALRNKGRRPGLANPELENNVRYGPARAIRSLVCREKEEVEGGGPRCKLGGWLLYYSWLPLLILSPLQYLYLTLSLRAISLCTRRKNVLWFLKSWFHFFSFFSARGIEIDRKMCTCEMIFIYRGILSWEANDKNEICTVK